MSVEPPPGLPLPERPEEPRRSDPHRPAGPGLTLAYNRMGSFDIHIPSEYMRLDPAALDVFDLRPDEYDGNMAVANRVPPEELGRLDTLIRRALENGTDVYGAYFRIRCRDGSRRWLHTQGHLVRDTEGTAYRVIGIVRDATRELDDAAKRTEFVETRRRLTGMVRRITTLLARATTVAEVTDALKDAEALSSLGAVSVMLGVVENGRVHTVTEGRLGLYVPELQYTRIDARFPMSEVVRTLRPRYITSREEFRRHFPPLWHHIQHLPVASGAYLPLIVQGRTIGALGMLYSRHGGFTGEERNLLVTLSGSIAQSLQRAMFFEQEHDLAESLQRAMLPHRVPDVPGARIAVRYRAARAGRDIGGDWYDVIPLPGGRVGLMIGDVQGHDTDAAAVMGQLRIALWAYVSEGTRPRRRWPARPPSSTSWTPTASPPAHTRKSTCRQERSRSSAPDISNRWCGAPTARASSSTRRAGCRSGSRTVPTGAAAPTTRSPGRPSRPARRSSSTPTDWWSGREPRSTKDSTGWHEPCGTDPAASRSWRTASATQWGSAAGAATTWRCCSCAGTPRRTTRDRPPADLGFPRHFLTHHQVIRRGRRHRDGRPMSPPRCPLFSPTCPRTSGEPERTQRCWAADSAFYPRQPPVLQENLWAQALPADPSCCSRRSPH